MVAVGTFFKSSDTIVAAGKYRCVVCRVIIDIPEHVAKMGKPFFACPICHAGEDGGAKGAHEDVWEYLG